MEEKKAIQDSELLSQVVINGMQEKKATDIVLMDLRKVKNSIADFFVICTGNSDSQIDAISESVESEVYKSSGQDPWHKEGFQNKEWILLDYVDVVVHIFNRDLRSFYSLEDLWGDAVAIPVESEY
jgi:ribosome-associated protein